MRNTILLILFLPLNLYALSPPPINFERKEVKVNGQTLIIEFKDNKVTIRKRERASALIATILLLSILFYGSIIFYMLFKYGLVIEALIFVLAAGLLIHIWSFFRRR